MELVFGNGKIWVSGVNRNGRRGILLRPDEESHEIDSAHPEIKEGDVLVQEDKDVVIWADNLEAARVLQDAVNGLCLRLNGFSVGDEKSK